jgi:hypothetical protein
MYKIGCFGWIAILVVVSMLSAGLENLGLGGVAIGVVVIAAAIVVATLYFKKLGDSSHSSELLHLADLLESWASGNYSNGTADTEGDEQALFDVTKVELLEFRSTGSSYSGGSAGISFPLFGRIRGNVGGSQGQIKRNPDVLTVVDIGTVKVTSERILFIGERESRVFELDKVLDYELGPNGLWVKIAMSNKSKREGFQHMALDQITLGMAFGVANAWSNDGEAAALKYARDAAVQIRNAMAAEAVSKSNN